MAVLIIVKVSAVAACVAAANSNRLMQHRKIFFILIPILMFITGLLKKSHPGSYRDGWFKV
jgi:hypothetical protein